ncbi:MAG TPA: hypothetical protein DDX92_01315 [Flavobacteriales bacterium]|jgi:hypothetical protein|nr:hypothetical protein [Flavobacteriales bacterium]
MYRVLFILGFWLFSSSVLAQDGATILSSFDSRLLKEGVFVSWTIKPGNFCLGLKLLRTTDTLSTEYSEVFVDPGICGEEDRSVTYTIIDSNASPGVVNYYQLILGFNPTHHLSEYVPESPDTKMLIGPVPTNNTLNVQVLIDNLIGYELFIYDTMGKLMGNFNLNSSNMRLDVSKFESGTYILYASGPDGFQLKRKFIVY